ncbi:MAG: hypothetical protein QM726_26035 [Chitinophagaceae bacterium]
MTDTIFFILSLSIIFAAIIGVIRFRKIDTSYHPFILYACLDLVVEIAVYVLLMKHKQNEVSLIYNIFGLAEFSLLVLLFHNWGLFKRKKSSFVAIISLSVLLFACTLFIRGYSKINYFSEIVNSFALIFFSISAFNTMILSERKNIFKNPKFWICIGIIIYYTCFILVYTEKLSFLNLHPSKTFDYKVWAINAYANLLVNLLYAVAVLWIPRNKNIITLF